MKVRIIPTILTDGLTVVKGENFNNWRTVGTAEATARLYANRNVDELMFLDVTARARNTFIDKNLIAQFSNFLDIPFSVGGGINSLQDARTCFRYGAEKIVLGTAAVLDPSLISEISDTFGNQAVIVAIDFEQDSNNSIRICSGSKETLIDGISFVQNLEKYGAGELLLQSIKRDGTMSGMDFNRIRQIAKLTKIPVISSGGASSLEDFHKAIISGSSAVAGGAIFQFTEITPALVRTYIAEKGLQVRQL